MSLIGRSEAGGGAGVSVSSPRSTTPEVQHALLTAAGTAFLRKHFDPLPTQVQARHPSDALQACWHVKGFRVTRLPTSLPGRSKPCIILGLGGGGASAAEGGKGPQISPRASTNFPLLPCRPMATEPAPHCKMSFGFSTVDLPGQHSSPEVTHTSAGYSLCPGQPTWIVSTYCRLRPLP